MDKKEENNSLNNSIPLATAAGATAATGLYNLGSDYIDKGRAIEYGNRTLDQINQASKSNIIDPQYPIIDDNKLKFISYDEFKQWLEDKGYGSNLFTQFVTDHPYLTTTSLISVAAIGAWLASKGVMWLYKKWREYCNNSDKGIEQQSEEQEINNNLQ